ncbi:bifunctional methylenetetrahydrofolate dehydrogenase/methenyltetrahydrofolate cyclohydrolase FolD [Aeoliella mucimassa]|uniref:Bifunctional protein FolD n=1 Tax=Aeoliella mucimassa TaxID=2527972 RepID=A0A518AUV6_9BACT|nr:bifunctional methylenetetrahydrofolate dehydrogenase/methenyltetrahydrofolate cyclohydrolase FolD [Aeoliella mucimassa]QDU58507.1 Tetrahydrofolate dehydrogenase/cyclohydrolase [Aeoliella mucimassa]
MSNTASIIDGKAIAQQMRNELAEEVAEFIQNNSVTPCLAAVLVGEDPASEVYVRNKRRACEHANIDSQLHRLPADITQDDLLALVTKLNKDDAVHGILVQLPLPAGLDADLILQAISPSKDVDAFHPTNVGRMVQGKPRFLPCTPHGVMQLLDRSGVDTAGKHAVVVGRSDIVGKPLAVLLAARGVDCTVTVCHSRTADLGYHTRQADILIAAIGKPEFITGDMIKPGAVVIDVGVNRTDAGLVGDVEFASASQVAGLITPVPGGVGPMTIAMLLVNTLRAAQSLEQ